MDHNKQIIVFGFGPYGEEIAKSLRSVHGDIMIVEQKRRNLLQAEHEGFTQTQQINIHDDLSFEELKIKEDAIVFCAFDDESFNTFLTLSLRARYEHLKIIAIGETKESTHKLMMAGATKVVVIEETGANIIYNMLINPHVSSLIEQILYFQDKLQISEITITKESSFIGKKLKEINLSESDDIIILGLIDIEISHKFVFASSGFNHKIDIGDTLVVMGSVDNIIKLSEKH